MIEIVQWQGTTAVDRAGREYIDLTAGGIFAATFGVNSPFIKRAIRRAEIDCAYSSRFCLRIRDEYYEALGQLTGYECATVYTSGSEAVEAFWRVCRSYTGKPGIWGGLVDPEEVGDPKPQCDQFHGWTLGSLIAGGRITWHELGIYPELGAGRFGRGPEHTACMIMEPYHAPSGQFHRAEPTIARIKSLRTTFPEIPLCIDEIQGGFGRTGKMFAHQHYSMDLRPDFITIGKLAFAGFPGSALLGPREIMESPFVREHAHLHSTHSGHPLVCSVGLAVIREMERLYLIDHAEAKGAILHRLLSSFPIPTHGQGLMAGLVFASPEEANRANAMCERRGLLVVPTGRKWLKIGPALTIKEDVLVRGISILREVVEEVTSVRNKQAETCGDSGGKFGESPGDVHVDGVPAPGSDGNAPSPEDGGSNGPGN